MDHFSEQILKQAMDSKRLCVILAAIAAAVAINAAIAVFLPWLFLPIVALCGFGLYWIVTSQSWEVEYAVTNGDIDIDRIVARRDRKTIVRVRGSKIQCLLPISKLDRTRRYDRVVMAARHSKTATWFFTYQGKQGSTLVIFEPNESVLRALCDGLSRVVRIETDRALREQ